MVKNMKFILVAKTMQAFAYLFFVNEQCSFSVCLGTLPCRPLSSTGTLKTNTTLPPLFIFILFTFLGKRLPSVCMLELSSFL